MGLVAVFCSYLPIFNDQLGGKGVGVLPVDQNIGCHFTEDGVSNADAFNPLQIKGIRQVLADKSHDTVMAFYQVGINKIPIVVAIQIDLA